MTKLRKTIIILLSIWLLAVIAGLIYLYLIQEDKVAILAYHDIVDTIEDDPNTTVNITTEKFEKQIKWLSKHNYKSITLDEFYKWKKENKKLPRKTVVIVFDDGWKSFYTKAIPILEKYNMKGSVFAVLKYSENCTNSEDTTYINLDEIKDIQNNHPNISVLSHSYNLHIRELAGSKDYETYNTDIQKVSTILEDSQYYAYPFGSRNDAYIKALKDNDYKLAFTFGPYDFASKDNDDYQIPRLGIFESTPDWKFKLKMFLEM